MNQTRKIQMRRLGIFTAVQEQLGLKQEPTKGLTDVLVIDRVKKPSEN